MEAQYYLPKIEEFYVGFECEILDAAPPENDWKQETIGKFHSFELLSKWLDAGEIRVKCLDEQDIIYLGWHDNLFLDKDGYIYRIEHINGKVLIYKIMTAAHKQDMVLFLGNIKNKSELKRIMQMLKIIE
jgi:hypothetical protein